MDCISFVNQFNLRTKGKELSQEEQLKLISNLIHPKKYIGIMEKEKFVISILKETIKITPNGFLINSFTKYLLFLTKIITLYTDLVVDIDGYDLLCNYDLLDKVLATFGKEYEVCLGIMNTYLDDINSQKIDINEFGR